MWLVWCVVCDDLPVLGQAALEEGLDRLLDDGAARSPVLVLFWLIGLAEGCVVFAEDLEERPVTRPPWAVDSLVFLAGVGFCHLSGRSTAGSDDPEPTAKELARRVSANFWRRGQNLPVAAGW